MSEAPEKIWAQPLGDTWWFSFINGVAPTVEYVRADTIEALRAELEAVKANAEAVCNSYADENQRLHDRATVAESRAAQLEAENGRLRANLDTRDKFIVGRDLWGDFVAQLPDAALLTGREG